tara:strand:+ start:56 stop:310 length:255 start_codon:yes stop_codon:yes gene_type:complete
MNDNKDKWIYESPDGGKTIYRREFNKHNERELIHSNPNQLNLFNDLNHRSDEWRIKQFNRNRDSSEWVHSIEELEDRIDKIFKD